MKKNDLRNFLGILAVLLTVSVCWLSYYRFGAAVIGFCILAFLLPTVFYFAWRSRIWFCPALAAVLDLVIFWPEFNYYESRGLFICAAIIQLLVMAAIILILKFAGGRLKR